MLLRYNIINAQCFQVPGTEHAHSLHTRWVSSRAVERERNGHRDQINQASPVEAAQEQPAWTQLSLPLL